MGGAALAGAVVVGGNPTHRGDELARDLSHTECQLLVTSTAYVALVEGHDLGPALPPERILVIDDPHGDARRHRRRTPLRRPAGGGRRPAPRPGRHGHRPRAPSGSCSSPRGPPAPPRRACAARAGWPGSARIVAQMFEITEDDVCYLPMPLFHSNALMAGWAPALAAGATAALRERFSASSSSPTSAGTASPTSTTWASRSPTCWPPPSGPTTPTTPCAGPSATRRPRPTWPGSPSGSAAPSRTPTAPPRAGRRSSGRRTPPGGRSGGRCPAP